MELELYPWKFCRARPSKMCCWAEAEQGTVTLSCGESPGKASVGSTEQIPFWWAGKDPVVLSQHSWGPGWSKSRAVCAQQAGLSLRRILRAPSAAWSPLGAGMWWPGTECRASSLSLAGSCSLWQARAEHGGRPSKMWPTDSAVNKPKEGRVEQGNGNAEGGVPRPAARCDTAGHSASRRSKFALAWNTDNTELSKSCKNWQQCEETH